jgi:predicted dehydrogenase
MRPQDRGGTIDSQTRTREGTLGVAVVGQGWWGRAIVRVLDASHSMRVVTTVDVDPIAEEFARERGVGFTTDYGAALGDEAVEAVILCTPHSLHTDQIARAARAGKHVFCEKPLALTRREAVASVEICNASGVVIGVGHEHRFKPPTLELARMVRSGELGTIMQSEATFTMDNLANLDADNWRRSGAEAPCGPLTATGVHALDLCVSVHGVAESVIASLRSVDGGAVDGALGIMLTFRSGAGALITSLIGPPFSVRFAVFGTQGWVEIRDKTHPETPEGWILTKCMRGGRMESVESPSASPVLANLEAFAAAAHGRAPYPIAQEEMIATISALEAIIISAASGQIVQVEG